MIGVTEQLNEAIPIPAAGIPPQSLTTTTKNSGIVDMRDFNRVRATLYIGAFGSNANVYLAAYQSQVAAGTNPIIVPGSQVPTLTAASSGPSGPGGSTGNDNEIATLEIISSQLTAGYRYLYFQVQVDQAATLICLFIEGCPAYAKPGSQFNADVVVQETNIPIT
jgi:hypothetical protein